MLERCASDADRLRDLFDMVWCRPHDGREKGRRREEPGLVVDLLGFSSRRLKKSSRRVHQEESAIFTKYKQ